MGQNLAQGTCGQLDFETWTLQLSFPEWSKSTIEPSDMGEKAVTLYHECRHAEQWYRVAQGVAAGVFVPEGIVRGQYGVAANAISQALGVPLRIALDAERTKRFFSKHVPQLLEPKVRSWFTSIYGTGAAHRDQVLTNVNSPDPDVARANFQLYRNLPEEADAHEVEQQIRALWKRKEPEPETLYEGLSALFN
jgi:hypothetical protein